MLASLKRKWIAALRSGKFKQGSGDLYDDGSYCCLGVLAKVQGAKVVNNDRLVRNGKDVRKDHQSKGHKMEFLDKQFCAGLHTKTQQRLGNMNDGKGAYLGKRKSFAEIADFIEKNY